jgi:NAD(P)-dependent dehydrogenase (short-subunit alcohol dehydrogenase family)
MTLFNVNALQGCSYLVTGASSGIGRAVAIGLAVLGGSVVVCGRDKDRLLQTIEGLKGAGHSFFTGDMSSADDACDMLKAIRKDRDEGFDGVFHSAGVANFMPVRMTKSANLDKILGASLFGAIGLARAAAGRGFFKPKGGSIAFMSSVAGERGQAGMSAYGASRAAISGLVKNLACELAPQNIRVNAIVASGVKTEMHEQISRNMSPDGLADYAAKHLLGFGEVESISNAAVFLMSDASKWITGTDLLVDGGYMAK